MFQILPLPLCPPALSLYAGIQRNYLFWIYNTQYSFCYRVRNLVQTAFHFTGYRCWGTPTEKQECRCSFGSSPHQSKPNIDIYNLFLTPCCKQEIIYILFLLRHVLYFHLLYQGICSIRHFLYIPYSQYLIFSMTKHVICYITFLQYKIDWNSILGIFFGKFANY